jgi:hypothetical protein
MAASSGCQQKDDFIKPSRPTYSRIGRLTAVSSQSEPSLAPWRRETLNHSSATGDQLENEHDHRDDQQQVDQAASNVAYQS